MKEHIGVLQAKIRYTEDLLLLGGRRVKTARSHGRKCLITIEHEYSRSFSHSFIRQEIFGSFLWYWSYVSGLYNAGCSGTWPGCTYSKIDTHLQRSFIGMSLLQSN